MSFDAHSRFGPQEAICITGSAGTIRARGPICAAHDLTLHTRRGCAKPELKGKWFNDGFRGAMGELLCAIEEDREPSQLGAGQPAQPRALFCGGQIRRHRKGANPGKSSASAALKP